ncbi:MAG: hypothetical protein KKH67_10755 [candidate division Zixibacteria bacterium]|nr:hypothetical protein [candidate division Zixibacteria bacterium]MBU1469779.1 hypothetical protein [candidate division Zixibacteria bacterium]
MTSLTQCWKSVIVIAAVGLIPAALIGCKSNYIAGQWASDPMSVDGQIGDWDGIPITYFEDKGAVLGMANDSSNLFIYLRFRDPMWARSIKMTGLTIWLDAKGKKSKDLSIRYVGGITKEEMTEAMEPNSDAMTRMMDEEQRKKMDEKLSQPDQFTLVDESRWYLPKDLDFEGLNGPAVAYASEQGFYNYEFMIPLHECTDGFYGLGVHPGHVLGIGAEWGDMGMGQRPSGMRGGDGPSGGGMPPGGGRGGGRGGGPPGDKRPEMPEKQEVWLRTTLAVNMQE